MPALSQSLEFIINDNNTTAVVYPNTATGIVIYSSEKAKGDGYYMGSDGIHTVMYTATPTFVGTVTMQATLAADPTESDWFDVVDTSVSYTLQDERNTTTNDYSNFTGNFVWVRGQVIIEDGSVEAIQYNH